MSCSFLQSFCQSGSPARFTARLSKSLLWCHSRWSAWGFCWLRGTYMNYFQYYHLGSADVDVFGTILEYRSEEVAFLKLLRQTWRFLTQSILGICHKHEKLRLKDKKFSSSFSTEESRVNWPIVILNRPENVCFKVVCSALLGKSAFSVHPCIVSPKWVENSQLLPTITVYVCNMFML